MLGFGATWNIAVFPIEKCVVPGLWEMPLFVEVFLIIPSSSKQVFCLSPLFFALLTLVKYMH